MLASIQEPSPTATSPGPCQVANWSAGWPELTLAGPQALTAISSATLLVIGMSGGLVGNNNGLISESYASGTVAGGGYAGGLTGGNYDRGIIRASYAIVPVSGNRENVGGLCGQNSGTITGSYSSGSVLGTTYVGGFVGRNSSNYIVGSSYSTGKVSGIDKVGGFFGERSGSGQIIGALWVGRAGGGLLSIGD